MKVHDTSIRGVDRESSPQKPQGPGGEKPDFQELLQKELPGAGSPASPHKSEAPREPQALFQPCPHLMMQLTGEEELHGRSADGVGRILDALETLEQAFTDSSKTGKNIDEQLQGIQRELSLLNPLLEELPQAHPLRTLGEELNILAHVESVKWNRGDYL